ncbi:RNA-binding protein 43 isoform X2 [Danio rerio]|nr:uncharacterized protein si:dkey-154b15.1 [Danio rerio]XP_009292543.1 uncharacterized protein si:dkey-154b15.1 [Danio rerio]|eukprot:XP_009292542.1 uncharacterized protein si:dkey-154b15.1 [Danio rerio]
MDMTGMVIEVNGLPDSYREDAMIDKLTIHFLRRCNKGEDVLTVIYPTSNKGQAYVVFESEEVPGVLEHTHVLQVESQFYPLVVKQVDLPLLDMPAETFLNMNLFSSHKKIVELLDNHGFQVTPTRSGQMQLQGSFLKLQLVYPKLMQILAEETHSQRTPSHYTNGYSDSASRAGSSDYEYKSRSNVTSRYRPNNGSSVYVMSRSTSSGVKSESPNKMAFLQTSSVHNGSSRIDSSFNSPSRNYEDTPTSIHRLSPRKTEDSFHADPDVMEYIMHFNEDSVEKIQSDYRTHISYVSVVDSEVVMVKLSRGDCEEAAKELRELIENFRSSLCTQEIDLNELDDSHTNEIFRKANSFQKIYKVLIRHKGSIIKVVGSSQNSYEAKQRLLGEKVEFAPAKLMERNVLRRSSSLTRKNTRQRMENLELERPVALNTTSASSSSASRFQKDSELQLEVPQERGRTPKSMTQRVRSQSATRSKHKSQGNQVNRELSNYDQQNSKPSNEAQKSNPIPKILAALRPETNTKIHQKFFKVTKSNK